MPCNGKTSTTNPTQISRSVFVWRMVHRESMMPAANFSSRESMMMPAAVRPEFYLPLFFRSLSIFSAAKLVVRFPYSAGWGLFKTIK